MKEEINYCYVVSMAVTSSLGFWLLGYGFAYFNVFTGILHRQYMAVGGAVITDEDLFNSIISGLIPIGGIFGALLIGPVVNLGRRVALMTISVVFICGTGATMVFNFYFLFFGRFVMGACIGAYATVSPLYISEIAPVSISGTLGVLNQFMAVTGILVAYSLSFLVPYPSDEAALTTGIWRFIFAFPASVAIIQFIILMFILNFDTPKYYKTINDMQLHDKIMGKIYKNLDDNVWAVAEHEKMLGERTNINRSEIVTEKTFGDLFSPQYRLALFVGICLSAFQQLSGVNGVIFHSNEIFTKGKSGMDADIAARIGTFFLGVSGFLGTFSSLFILKWLGRKPYSSVVQ